METLDDALGHQPSLLWLVLDLFLRRGVVSSRVLCDYLIEQSGAISMSNLGVQAWVWDVAVMAVERSIDIANASVAMMKHSTPVEMEMQDDEEDGDHHSRKRSRTSEVSEEVMTAVESACSTCKYVCTRLVVACLGIVAQRKKSLPASVAKMDHQIITATSLLHRVCFLYHATQRRLANVEEVDAVVCPEWSEVESAAHNASVVGVELVKKFWA